MFSCWVWSSHIVPSQKLIQEGEGLVLIRKLLRSGGRLETGQFRRMRDFETLVTKIRLRILVIKNGSISFWDLKKWVYQNKLPVTPEILNLDYYFRALPGPFGCGESRGEVSFSKFNG